MTSGKYGSIDSFQFATTPHIISAPGAVTQLGALCAARKLRRILLITDPGLFALGLMNTAVDTLKAADIAIELFHQVEADPSEATVLAATQAAKHTAADAIIGFGGGSSMDVAKIVSLLAHPACTQTLNDIYGVDNIYQPRLPLIQVPTTAGTGSEVTPIAIITTGQATKSGIVSHTLLPDIALLDAELTLGLPPSVTAATGIDAMVHAIEAYTSRIKKNPLSDMLAKKALELLSAHIATAVHQGDNITARNAMMLGATLAGQAFANAPVGGVHALAYPLGGRHHIPHGLSNSLVLPAVLKFNLSHAAELYAELAPIVVHQNLAIDNAGRAQQFIQALEALITEVGLPTRLRDVGIVAESLPALATDAMLQTRLLINNPKTLTEAEALDIYRAVF